MNEGILFCLPAPPSSPPPLHILAFLYQMWQSGFHDILSSSWILLYYFAAFNATEEDVSSSSLAAVAVACSLVCFLVCFCFFSLPLHAAVCKMSPSQFLEECVPLSPNIQKK